MKKMKYIFSYYLSWLRRKVRRFAGAVGATEATKAADSTATAEAAAPAATTEATNAAASTATAEAAAPAATTEATKAAEAAATAEATKAAVTDGTNEAAPTAKSAKAAGAIRTAGAAKATRVTGAAAYRANAILFNENFLNEHYLLRYNTMKRITEYRPKPAAAPAAPAAQSVPAGLPAEAAAQSAPTPAAPAALVGLPDEAFSPLWQPLTDRDLNRLTVEQLKAGGQSWSYGMQLLTESTCIADFNPVKHYLDTCPQWDRQHDYIAELAQRVPTDYADWTRFFHRWMLAMVAQVRGMSREHGNAVVPMLIGEQGTRKSTFCKMLLPRELREYYMDDVKMDNAEQVERVLGRMWLVNIDEYNSKTVREQAKIKRLLTEHDVQVRRMHSDQYTMTPRMASFIATTNDRQPLTDPTGSRRYLCVEVQGLINTDSPIDHRQLFAQALWELEHGHTYWFTHEDEAAIEEHNRPYRVLTAADELLMACYEPAPLSSANLTTVTEMMRCMQEQLKGADRPTMRQLIEALKNQRFSYGAQHGRHGWYARRVQRVAGDENVKCEHS
jgi:hypothetical protein